MITSVSAPGFDLGALGRVAGPLLGKDVHLITEEARRQQVEPPASVLTLAELGLRRLHARRNVGEGHDQPAVGHAVRPYFDHQFALGEPLVPPQGADHPIHEARARVEPREWARGEGGLGEVDPAPLRVTRASGRGGCHRCHATLAGVLSPRLSGRDRGR